MTAELLTVADTPIVTATQIELIRSTIAKDATDAELQLFFYDNQRRGVHPLDRLIHFTKRGGKYTPIVSIDFMRMRAATTGDCAGIEDAAFVGTPKDPQTFAATVTVYRFVQGRRCPFTGSARWMEFKPEANDFMWHRMPHVMLGKCAEAIALRKGFPQQLAGLYVSEEMDQADDGDRPPKTPPKTKAQNPTIAAQQAADRAAKPTGNDRPISDAQRIRLFAIAKEQNMTKADVKALLPEGIESTKDLPRSQYDAMIARIQAPDDEREPGQEG